MALTSDDVKQSDLSFRIASCHDSAAEQDFVYFSTQLIRQFYLLRRLLWLLI